MKILVVRLSSIGDIVLTTPVVRCLKQQLSGVELHYLTREHFRVFMENNPYIDRCHFVKDNIADVIPLLKKEKFDLVVDLHHNIKTLRLKWSLGVKSVSFRKLNIEKWIFTKFKWNLLPALHIVERYMDTVKHLGIVPDGNGLDYFIPEKEEVKDNFLPASHRQGFVAMVIGAALPTKKMPMSKMMEICRQVDHPMVLLGGKEDFSVGEKLAKAYPEKIFNSCGFLNLNQSADLLRKSKLVITHDTGLMHIAAALKKKIISVWGNTVPEFGMTPFYGSEYWKTNKFSASDIVEVQGLYCRPCSKIGYKKCPLGHFKCMNGISSKSIAQRVNVWWE
jgi:heptosyltransferase-2